VGAVCVAVYLFRRPGQHRMYALWGLRIQAAAAVSSVVLVSMLGYLWWGLGPPGAYPRFWAPVVLACMLFPIALLNGDRVHRRPLSTGAAGVALVFLIGTVTLATPGLAAGSVLGAAGDTASGRVSKALQADRYAAQRDEYQRAAALVPPGSKVLAAVDVPSLLLSRRSDVNTIDLVGSTSPPPHLPYFRGNDAKLAWLRARGYQYVVGVDPDASACLYSRSLQEQNLRGEHGQPYGAWAPYYLDWFQFLHDESSRRGSAILGSLIVLKL
jgi:hypothetical protein